jgi:hydrogenase nickel incorporation protein HypA/HybF
VHELSLASAIVDTAERHAGGRPVRVISLRVGELRQVVPDSLEFYVELVGRDTLCEGARVELELILASLRCSICGEEWRPPGFRCALCGEAGEVVAGQEFEVESIEIEAGVGSTEPDNEPGGKEQTCTAST